MTTNKNRKRGERVRESEILIYDVDPKRVDAISDRLKMRGHPCITVYSCKECIEHIESKRYKYVFIGRSESDLEIIEVMRRARERMTDVLPFDLFDHPDKEELTKKIVQHIENIVR
jgi:DNA-binding response OmpR family regulator